MKKFRAGLVVGKFSPLHVGHQYLIDTALEQCEHVYIITYSVPTLGASVASERLYWLQSLYPNRVTIHSVDQGPHNDLSSEQEHRWFCANICLYTFHATVDAVFTSEGYGDGFAAVLTESFKTYADVSKDVVHVCVDLHRTKYPISGTAVRADIHGHEMFLDPLVYRSMVPRIAFVGGESSGKTTLVNDLQHALGDAARSVMEYGREYGNEIDNDFRLQDMVHIAEEQIRRERSVEVDSRTRIVLCDTTPMVTQWYSFAWYKQVDPRLRAMAGRHYDFTFVCKPTFPFVQDGTRVGHTFRQKAYEYQREELRSMRTPFFEVEGTPEERVQSVIKKLKEWGYL